MVRAYRLIRKAMELLNDFDTSVAKALSEINPRWRDLPGLIVCGTHAPHDTDYLIEKIGQARVDGVPFYGECFGFQLAAIEWARHVLNIPDATSEEFGVGTFVVKKRNELKVGLHDGESWWSYFEVDPIIEQDLMKHLPKNYFVAPYHPSYQSSKDKPHPLLRSFVRYAMAV